MPGPDPVADRRPVLRVRAALRGRRAARRPERPGRDPDRGRRVRRRRRTGRRRADRDLAGQPRRPLPPPGGHARGAAARGRVHGFGRCPTDAEGQFAVRHRQARARLDGPQAPHIDVSVFARGLLRHLVHADLLPGRGGGERGRPAAVARSTTRPAREPRWRRRSTASCASTSTSRASARPPSSTSSLTDRCGASCPPGAPDPSEPERGTVVERHVVIEELDEEGRSCGLREVVLVAGAGRVLRVSTPCSALTQRLSKALPVSRESNPRALDGDQAGR